MNGNFTNYIITKIGSSDRNVNPVLFKFSK